MWTLLNAKRWPYVVAAALLVAVSVALQIDIRTDARHLGHVDDLATLRERSDVNLLFILIDTLRADRLSSYGYPRNTSPTLDRLAASGIRFARQMSQSSWTKCSMASLWTGLYPVRTGVTRAPHALSEDARTPAEILRDAGFQTFGIWRNGWIAPSFGFAQGFDVYHSPAATPLPATVRREKPTIGVAGTDQDVIDSAIEFLRARGDERWFLYLHLMDVHQYVYDEESALFGTRYSDIYDNSIHWVDGALARLVRDLERRGLRDRTVIAVAADHGEAFGEHGREGHARDVYSEVVTTPFILSLPFALDPGIVVAAPSENVDIWPTLLDLLGLPGLADADGRSRVREILSAGMGDEPPSSPGPRYSHIDQAWGRSGRPPRPMVAVSEGRFRLVLRAGRDRPELYDRSADPLEQREIGAEQPTVMHRLTTLAEDYLARPPAPWRSAPDVDLDDDELEHLRALGYVVESR